MWRLVNYSLCIAIVIIGISYGLRGYGGTTFVQPGVFSEVMLNGVLLLIPTGETFLKLPTWSHVILNLIIYSVVIFVLLFLVHLAKAEAEESK